MLRALGDKATPEGGVTNETTVLIRGSSPLKFGDWGRKERKAAQLLRMGHNLAIIDIREFRKLFVSGRPARLSDHVAGQPIDWLLPVTLDRFQKAPTFLGPLDQEHTERARVEQGFLRQHLLKGAEEATCALCSKALPDELLVAGHIKPRSYCSRKERLDYEHIAFLVCMLGCDALYEKGFVYRSLWRNDPYR